MDLHCIHPAAIYGFNEYLNGNPARAPLFRVSVQALINLR
jgi:hypothetical protein